MNALNLWGEIACNCGFFSPVSTNYNPIYPIQIHTTESGTNIKSIEMSVVPLAKPVKIAGIIINTPINPNNIKVEQ
jgi:hypothetical protein